MNRSILIVICDFLLLSLLTFSTDINHVVGGRAERPGKMEVAAATNAATSGKDLAAVMRLALEEERKSREQLLSELNKTRTTAGQRDQQAQILQQQLQAREEEARGLQAAQAKLEQQFAAAQTNIQTLSQQLQGTSTEALLSKEKLAAMEAEARRRAEEAAALQQQLAQLGESNRMVLTEKQRLAGQLQVAEVERRHAAEQVVRMSEEVKTEREEKAKLAEGVKALASNSGQLAQEIRENRALAPNTIFNDFVSNRVDASIAGTRAGFFGNETSRRKETKTVLVTDGTNTYALCHVQDTPLALWVPGTDWEALSGALAHGAANVQIRSLSFSFRDPRVVWMPVSDADAQALGSKAYRTSLDPFKFQDAVLVGGQEGYYGECKFQIDLSTPDYVKLDNNFLKGLLGKFNPSRGDLVFSKTGELLGIMVNSTYCMMIRNFDAGATFRFGGDVRAQHTGETLSGLCAQVLQMPLKLQ
jgi:hypothetical protein